MVFAASLVARLPQPAMGTRLSERSYAERAWDSLASQVNARPRTSSRGDHAILLP